MRKWQKRLVGLTLLAAALMAAWPPKALATAKPPTPVIKLRVAAASDLREALPVLVTAFRQQGKSAGQTPTVEPVFGSSGKLYAQIANGAPFDAFFSADSSYAEKLEAAGLAVPGSRFVYGVGRLVLWTPKSSGVPVESGLAALDDAGVSRVAIANPALAPYGRAAEQVLRHAGRWDSLQTKLVRGENVAQAAQMVTSGGAQLGFVPLALMSAPAMQAGRHWTVPETMHEPLIQAAVRLRRSKYQREVADLMAFIRGPQGRAVLEKHGFSSPAGAN